MKSAVYGEAREPNPRIAYTLQSTDVIVIQFATERHDLNVWL